MIEWGREGGAAVKRKCPCLCIAILICAGVLLCELLPPETEDVESLVRCIRRDSDQWAAVLDRAAAEGEIPVGSGGDSPVLRNLPVENVEYAEEYSGIFLVVRHLFPSKDGILLTREELPEIPMDRNLGICIERLSETSDFFIYWLRYYWD